MAYTLQDYRDLIRTNLDLESDELSDAMVDEWVRDAAQKLQYGEWNWSWYHQTWTFATVAGTGDYTLATIKGAATNGIAEILSIRGDGRTLEYQSSLSYERQNPVGSVSTGEPYYWSKWGSTITLDPEPTAVETLTVRGIAEPADWVSEGAGGASDAPEPFDRVILNWALGEAYSQQGEPESSVFYLDLANLRLEELTKQFNDVERGATEELVMGGGERRNAWRLDDTFLWKG